MTKFCLFTGNKGIRGWIVKWLTRLLKAIDRDCALTVNYKFKDLYIEPVEVFATYDVVKNAVTAMPHDEITKAAEEAIFWRMMPELRKRMTIEVTRNVNPEWAFGNDIAVTYKGRIVVGEKSRGCLLGA